MTLKFRKSCNEGICIIEITSIIRQERRVYKARSFYPDDGDIR